LLIVMPYGSATRKQQEPESSEVHESTHLKKIREERAARLLAEDKLSDDQIAEECGISLRCLAKWKKREEFQARIRAIVKAYAVRILATGIARKERRIQVLNDLHDKALEVIEERGKDPAMAKVPGGRTGLLVRGFETVHTKEGTLVSAPTYEADTGLMYEIRKTQQQVAQELGQWTEQHFFQGQIDSRNVNLSAELNAAVLRAMGLTGQMVPLGLPEAAAVDTKPGASGAPPDGDLDILPE
jgi:flagellar biosynthesis component FlhA